VREPGTVKATYGTGTSLMTLTSGRIMSRSGLSSTIAWSTGAGVAYALEGNISVSGQAVAFMGSLLGLADPAAVAELAATVPDSNGVIFVPALVGLGAPYWDPDAAAASRASRSAPPRRTWRAPLSRPSPSRLPTSSLPWKPISASHWLGSRPMAARPATTC
jgi:glycerol kinase